MEIYIKALILIVALGASSKGSAEISAVVGDSRFFTDKTTQQTLDVITGQILTTSTDQQLITTGLASCTAIAIALNGQLLLGHITATDDMNILTNEIKKLIGETRIPVGLHIFVLPGDEKSTLSWSRVYGVISDLRLMDHAVFFDRVPSFRDKFGINSEGLIYLSSKPQS